MPMKMITKNRKSGNGLEIRTTFTDLEESPRRRSLIDYFFLSIILCLGILGMVFTTASCFCAAHRICPGLRSVFRLSDLLSS